MSKYIPFTTEQKERAASVDLEEFLRRRGEKLITSGRDKRLASDHSITIRGCEWFDHATEQGGRSSGTREKLPQLHEKPSLPYCDCFLAIAEAATPQRGLRDPQILIVFFGEGSLH